MNRPPILAYTVRQCRVCKRILRFPIVDMADAMALSYPHCLQDGEPIGTEYLETVGVHEDQ